MGEQPQILDYHRPDHDNPAYTERHSSRRSLGGAIGVGVAFALLMVLEKTHQKADPHLATDNERVGNVMLCVLFAAVMTVLSVVCAIHPLSKRDFRPLVWLAAIAAAWVAFGLCFDFRGLLK